MFISSVKYKNVKNALGLKLLFNLLIIYDKDGTFTRNISTNSRLLYEETAISKTIVANFSYLKDPACVTPTASPQIPANIPQVWDGIIICNGSVKIRKASIYRYLQYSWGGSLGLARIEDFTSAVPT